MAFAGAANNENTDDILTEIHEKEPVMNQEPLPHALPSFK
jgi:hypothetical protein